jgi:hypothetical protein
LQAILKLNFIEEFPLSFGYFARRIEQLFELFWIGEMQWNQIKKRVRKPDFLLRGFAKAKNEQLKETPKLCYTNF